MPVSMMVPLKVSRSTIAAQSLGSVKVLVQPEKDSLEAIATLFFSSRSVRTWNSSSAPCLSQFRVAQLVDAEEIHTAVTGDGLGELFVVGGFDQLVDEFGGQYVADPETGHGGLGAQRDEQVGLAGAGVPDQADRVPAADPVAGGQRVHGRGFDVLVGVEVEVLEPLAAREAGRLDASLGTAPVTVLAFGNE
ncbi:hypothetical protein Are01nite_85220 [Actinoplanes regularis]|nr:hypothetical protein Are01nite_85220 [Actinoplanes regularis]